MEPFTIKEILTHFPDCKFYGKDDNSIGSVIDIKSAAAKPFENAASWINDKYAQELSGQKLNLGLLILSEKNYELFKNNPCNFLIAENPRQVFSELLNLKFKMTRPAKIESTAIIHESVVMGSNCYIGHYVIIEKNCVIQNDVEILHNTVILENTQIGNHVKIGCNNTIGNYGFGYEKDAEGKYKALQHLGKVVIKDGVEIHNNTCIDRGVAGDTIIGEDVKIDNLVHIAHGVVIHANSLVIANAMIAGSVEIGENCWIAPSVSIKNGIKIADNTTAGIGAVVLKNTDKNDVVVGNPSENIEDYKKWSELRKKMLDK